MKIPGFALHEQALKLRALRNEVLSSNIANADTPNYKARDIDFAAALRQASASQPALKATAPGHLQPAGTHATGADVRYRVPTQPSLDGNTVQSDVEQAAFAENAVQYRASLQFLGGTISRLRYAIKGGE